MKNLSTSLICLDQITIDSDFNKILNIGRIKKNCNYNWAHADFMDGHFVPRLGIAPELIQHLRRKYKDQIIIDSHMMVDDPFTYADVVCPYSDYYMFHVEVVKDPMRTIQKVRKNWSNVKVGLYFNLSTDIKNYEYILDEIDCIGLMGISPGVLGTRSYFDIITKKMVDYKTNIENKEKIIGFKSSSIANFESSFEKKLVQQHKPLEIFIDGSVNFETIPKYFELGATTLVCGSSSIANKEPVFGPHSTESDFEKNINKIEESFKCLK